MEVVIIPHGLAGSRALFSRSTITAAVLEHVHICSYRGRARLRLDVNVVEHGGDDKVVAQLNSPSELYGELHVGDARNVTERASARERVAGRRFRGAFQAGRSVSPRSMRR